MNRALMALHLLSLRGRAVTFVRLLRKPRYVAGLVAGILYFTWFLGPQVVDDDGLGIDLFSVMGDHRALVHFGVALLAPYTL